ncbi:MAG: hypothetical protein R3E97_00625 [Candidatus Eisenbacteria bacterium]
MLTSITRSRRSTSPKGPTLRLPMGRSDTPRREGGLAKTARGTAPLGVAAGIAVAIGVALVTLVTPARCRAGEFDELHAEQRIADFRTEAIYENEAGVAIGARFRHVPSRFVLDILRIQSLPQAFVWVNTFPPSDQGEPHTLEHLLLGKGTVGRRVASLEEMSLGNSSAFTQQRRTCYHFHTSAGAGVFFDLFEAKLDAMLHPNYSDEEIRREVCNIGVASQPDGSVRLEEKGTVYNEMVSSFERPRGNLYHELGQMVYGTGHPLSYDSGGTPEGIRDLTPAEIREFHGSTHHLNNMGAVVSIGDEVTLEKCLGQLSEILARVEPDSRAGTDPATARDRLPAAQPSPEGSIFHARFPHENPNEPGLLVMAWPPTRELDLSELDLLGLFFQVLAGGQTSNLQRLFIDSQTRVMDIGATSVFSWVDDDLGQPIFLGFSNVDPAVAAPQTLQQIRTTVLDEIRRIAAEPEGSEALAEFNDRARSLLLQNRRSLRTFLNSPPRFGYRGTGSVWVDRLQSLHEKGGFRRDLGMREEFAYADSVLGSGGNPWSALVESWGLLTAPFVAVTTADPEAIARSENERSERIATFTQNLRDEFDVSSDAAAIVRYEGVYEESTRVIDQAAATIDMPGLIKAPPLSLDDGLDYVVTELPGGGDLVTSRFDNMTAATAGIAFDLHVVPEAELVWVPALPNLLRMVGVIENGVPVTFDDYEKRLQQEILELDFYFSTHPRTGRAELVVRGAGSDVEESRLALQAMQLSLMSPDLRPENLPRIRDVIDQTLGWSRNRMRGSEESWVQDPALAYWKQADPLYLSASSFLTQTHALHRVKWMLESGSPEDRQAFTGFFSDLTASDACANRSALEPVLAVLTADVKSEAIGTEDVSPALVDEAAAKVEMWRVALSRLPEGAKDLVREAARDLEKSLADLSPDSFRDDVQYLTAEMSTDLGVDPSEALRTASGVLDRLRHQDIARAFVIGSTADGEQIGEGVRGIVGELSAETSERQTYVDTPRIVERIKSRLGSDEAPLHVGLVNESTRSGVHVHTSNCASYADSDEETLLRFLAARLYGGGGAHSMFMKTWSAGLAYSNGLRSNEDHGRLLYYAERCPDLAQTLQFVIEELRNAPHDPSLADYAIAQAFAGIRSGSRYEERGEAMAADLADAMSPEVVKAFRTNILALRKKKNLYDQLHERMEDVYGTVLPGYGPSTAEAVAEYEANSFVIGPSKQLDSWENYLGSVEPGARLQRIYPRDFWLAEGQRPGD